MLLVLLILRFGSQVDTRCHDDAYLQHKIDLILSPFKEGITEAMIDQLITYPRTCLVEIRDKKMRSSCLDGAF